MVKGMKSEPLTFASAESCLKLTILALSNVLSAADQTYLEHSMKTYAQIYHKEKLDQMPSIGP